MHQSPLVPIFIALLFSHTFIYMNWYSDTSLVKRSLRQ